MIVCCCVRCHGPMFKAIHFPSFEERIINEDVLQCLLCGRDAARRPTADELVLLKRREMANDGVRYERKERIRQEFAAIEPLEPTHRGRPPGSKDKRAVAMEASA